MQPLSVRRCLCPSPLIAPLFAPSCVAVCATHTPPYPPSASQTATRTNRAVAVNDAGAER